MRDTDSRVSTPYTGEKQFFGHPRGLATLFFTEMWERFSYYGMRALLILFMTAPIAAGGLGFDVRAAGILYGLYTAMAYMAALPGGWIADRLIGQRKAVLYGGILIAAGNYVLAVPSLTAFYSGLLLVVLGTGLLKPNVSAIVGQLYSREDNRRDSGFSLFYMGINLGAFLAPLACGYVAVRVGWRAGFLLAGIGMTLGLLQYLAGQKHLGKAGAQPAAPPEHSTKRSALMAALGAAALLAFTAFLAAAGYVDAQAIVDASGTLLLVTVVAFFIWLLSGKQWTPVERRRLFVILVLFLASVVFWSVFEQAGSSLNLFAQHNTDNQVGGFDIPAPWYQSINALFIITLAPVFSALWLRMGSREPSSPAKFSLGLGFVGLGFLVLAIGAAMAEGGVKVSPLWLLVTYLLHTIGELFLSPVGLSAMTKLAPERLAGLMMGVWFLSISVGNYLGGRLASLYEAMPLPQLFGYVGLFAVGAGLVLLLVVRPIVRLMEGVR